MKKRVLNLAIMLLVSTGVVLMSGCACKRASLVDSGAVSLERVPSKYARVSVATVYQEEDQLVVSGAVKRDYFFRSHLRGHVDVETVDLNGEVLEQVCASYLPREIPRMGSRSSMFKVRMPVHPDKGSRVRLTHRNTRYCVEQDH
ncbi:MAG: hypothetical protein ABIH23_13220 [bacterium]